MTYGNADNGSLSYNLGISPALNLKSNVMITSGTGTKTDPFELTITSTPLPPTSDVEHKIDVYSVEGGSIEVNPVSASAGTTITITVLPDKGYEYAGATITNSNGDYLELNANQTSFKMPSGQIIIIPKFTAS